MSLKVNDVLAFLGKRCLGTYQLNVRNINNGKLDLSNTSIYISEEEAYGKYKHFLVDPGDLVIASSGIVVENFHNKIAFVSSDDLPLCMNTSTIRFKSLDSKRLDINYFRLFLGTNLFKNQLSKLITGSAQLNFGPSHLKKINILLPPIRYQIRIATLLSRVEALIATRKENLRLLDEFLESTFFEMFGDPVQNSMGWKKRTLRAVAEKFSDGPFGSNLKTSHYEKTGIRVIRLNNIGIWEFLDHDKAYVSIKHYENVLKKYTCYPGDIVIATMGTPNIRACLVPERIKIAINKADCILCRVKKKEVNAFYLLGLLNSPAFLFLVSKLLHGQTRIRVSMGQLSKLQIPIPPIDNQIRYANIVKKIESIKTNYKQSLTALENLYASLSQKAFKGELDLSRIPLEEQFETETATNEPEPESEAIPIKSTGAMSHPASREHLLRRLFDKFIADQKGASFSLEDFWSVAEDKVADQMDDESLPLGTADYDNTRTWLFELIDNGRVDQRFDEDNNRMELKIKK